LINQKYKNKGVMRTPFLVATCGKNIVAQGSNMLTSKEREKELIAIVFLRLVPARRTNRK